MQTEFHMMITDVEDYFEKGCGRCERFSTQDCSARRWAIGLHALRRICLGAGLVETAKWGHPVYMHAERNIAIIGAYRGDFRLKFWNPALLKDAGSLLEKSGPNAGHPDIIRFSSNDSVAKLEPVIAATIAEAMGHAESGKTPPEESRELVLPEELVDALRADPELSAGFGRLTPGRQRSYVIALGSAKTSATRIARIAKFRGKIIAGKGATER